MASPASQFKSLMLCPLLLIALLGSPGSTSGNNALGTQVPAAAATTEDAQGKRQVRRAHDKPIDIQIRPSDQELELLDYGASPGLLVVDEHGKLLETLTRVDDLVAVVKLTDIASELSAGRTWVRSIVTAEILELWKARPETKGEYQVGTELVFPWEGGTVSVAGRTVRARILWVRALQRDATYLAFGWFPDGELRISPQSLYKVEGQRLSSVSTAASGQDDIEQDTLDNVRRRVKQAISKP